jgi:hypothetical protein
VLPASLNKLGWWATAAHGNYESAATAWRRVDEPKKKKEKSRLNRATKIVLGKDESYVNYGLVIDVYTHEDSILRLRSKDAAVRKIVHREIRSLGV